MSVDGGSEFETALAELEAIVQALDERDLRLDEALELFERGVTRLRTAQRWLGEARDTVEELIEEVSGKVTAVEFEVPEECPVETDGD
ncbi:MAG: exodeoxyribonuclease VII small subunit [Gemmatimonadota bacterium]